MQDKQHPGSSNTDRPEPASTAEQVLQQIKNEDPEFGDMLSKDPTIEGDLLKDPEMLRAIQVRLTRTEIRTGELFSAKEMIQLNQEHEGFIQHFLNLSQQVQENNFKLTARGMRYTLTERILGQVFGFTIVMTCLIGGIYAVFQGFEELGYSLIGINLAAVASVFVLGKKRDAASKNKT